jgi:ESCRT-I complex subunit TSG101
VKNFTALKLTKKEFLYQNGAKEDLACLAGTIPVHIQGSTYNIPVAIFLRKEYPYYCPTCIVQPTPDMMISPSQYVNAQGMVFLPYLHEWKHEASDLTTLIQIMSSAFSEKSPVYARPPGQQQPQPRPTYGGTPFPNNYSQYPQTGSNQSYPSTTGSSQMPQPQHPQSQSSYHSTPYPPFTSYQHQHTHTPAVPVATAVSAEDERKRKEEREKAERESLVSAVTDRVKRLVREALEQGEIEMSQLIETEENLKKGSEELNRKIQELGDEKHKVEAAVDQLKMKTAEIQSVIEQLEQQEDVNVDEAVTGSNVVYNQILHLYAEENAIDDTLYYLTEALRKGVIPVGVYLKHVREISRDQFMKRALIIKARATAGLPDRKL